MATVTHLDQPKDFPGNGTIKCAICAKPLVDHELRPCPELRAEVIYVDHQNSRGLRPDPTGICRMCNEPALPRKKGNGMTLYCSDDCRKQFNNQTKRRAG